MTGVRAAISAILLLLAGVWPLPVTATEVASEQEEAASDRRVMVMLKLGADHYRAGGDYGGPYGDVMGEKARLRIARSIARRYRLTLIEAWPMQLIGVDCVIMGINDDRSAAAVAEEISKLPGVEWSQPLNEYRMQAGATKQDYNDRLFGAQPAAQAWNLPRLHRMATGRGVTVAIVDSRIDTRHPDFAGKIVIAPDFVVPKRAVPESHGTGVAGIIAAQPNNALGIAGVAPDARVLGLRACWERPLGGATVCDTLSLAKALTFALENKADVINLSLTGPQDRLLETLIGLAIKRNLTIVAAVDKQRPKSSFPAFVPGVLPVSDERLPSGMPPVYIAPGRDIPTTGPDGKWTMVSGSSFAAAHVSGLAALMHQIHSQRFRTASGSTLMGPRGAIDACAALARVSQLDGDCSKAH